MGRAKHDHDHICITPRCKRMAVHRGCCRPCYLRHWQMVCLKLTTWAQLEAQGKVRPPKSWHRLDYQNHKKPDDAARQASPGEGQAGAG